MIVFVSAVPAGQLQLPADAAPPTAPLDVSTLPAFCRVTAVSRPSADSEIALEVWLPTGTWNTQFQPVGNGLWGGSINYAGLAGMLRGGYATASNDTGHRGAGASFALGFPYGTDFMRYLVMKDAAWHPRTRPVDFDRDAAAADAVQNRIVNVEPNLNAYLERGGKLLFVGGWGDGAIAPASNTNFYERVVRNAGPRAAGSVRLFMVPDMGHCPATATAANGYVVDTAGILEAWRSTGKAPDSIVVTRKVNGADERKMLVCKYPQSAVYKGSGDPSVSDSFTCR
jgi:feruloyl esterase